MDLEPRSRGSVQDLGAEQCAISRLGARGGLAAGGVLGAGARPETGMHFVIVFTITNF